MNKNEDPSVRIDPAADPKSKRRTPGSVPLRALLISVAALAVPLIASTAGAVDDQYALLIWLPALIPAFLLTYYRGWGGASSALAAAMATLAFSQAVVSSVRAEPPNWTLLLIVVFVWVAVCLGIGWIGELLHRARRTAEAEALRDPLTGLANRGHINLFLDTALGSAQRGGYLVVVIFDLDRFKSVNDNHGHAAGDATLVAFAEVLKTFTRRSDLSGRFGGEEFITILTGSGSIKGAKIFAERVRDALRSQPFRWGPVTASAGIAGYVPGIASPDQIMSAADAALYRAKAEGRDRVVVAGFDGSLEAPQPSHPETQRAPAPASRAPAAPPTEEAAAPTRSALPGAARRDGARILVVAEDEITRRGVARVLRGAGFRTRTAADGARGLEKVASGRPPQLVVADLVMSGVGGLTLASRARETHPDIRVLLMTGYEENSMEGAVPSKGVTFIKKPLTSHALVEAVRLALSSLGVRQPR